MTEDKKPICNYCGKIADELLSDINSYNQQHHAGLFKETEGISTGAGWLFSVNIKRYGCCGTIGWVRPYLHQKCRKRLFLDFFEKQVELFREDRANAKGKDRW